MSLASPALCPGAFAVARPGSTVGIVGLPHGEVPFAPTFFRNTGWRGGVRRLWQG
jgi:threonine dehydrogenase-like Zn-dependent dehydrogenase